MSKTIILSNLYSFKKLKHLLYSVLVLGFSFDQPIILTPNIEVLILGHCFDKPIVLTKKSKF